MAPETPSEAVALASASITHMTMKIMGRCVCVCVCVCTQLLQSCPSLCDPMDSSPPVSSVHGILQARIQSELPCSPPGDLPNPGIKRTPVMSPALAGRFFTTSATWEAQANLTE